MMAKLLGEYSKEDRSPEIKEQDENGPSPEFKFSVSDITMKLEFNMWHSVGPINMDKITDSDEELVHRTHSEQLIANDQENAIIEWLSILGSQHNETSSKEFQTLRTSLAPNCLPLLIKLIHSPKSTKIVRDQASQVLHNIVQYNADEKQGRKEAYVLKLIDEILEYCEGGPINLAPALGKLMKLSFDVEYRHAMCQFGALHALAKLTQTDHERCTYDVRTLRVEDVVVRRYTAMALTNLTYGDSTNKSILSSLQPFMRALVAQLDSPSEDLCQVTAGVIRNISWRANAHTRDVLREINAVKMLMNTVLRVQKEATLKACLSALWNLSAHNDLNKIDICNIDGAIDFLAKMLNYQAPSRSLIIIENVGGILRNISKLIAVNDDFREILRKHDCLHNLLQQLRSTSMVVVNNACGTLWNLTARCEEDQRTLIQFGAVNMLRSLTHSKHKMISVASSAALKNLMSSQIYPASVEINKPGTLTVRKQRALNQEMDMTLYDFSDILNENESSGYDRLSENKSNEGVYLKTNELSSNGYRKLEESYNTDDSTSDYIETDLDQPTNYSLRFGEISDLNVTEEESSSGMQCKKKLLLETPLMFSRSSSLGTVSSYGEQEDDQGSTISEFSRAISGIVSPSELPDSPTQTIPSSPRTNSKSMAAYYTDSSKVKCKSAPIRSVFEDSVTVFKDEHTPIVFSVATSFNSLTFDDELPAVEEHPSGSNATSGSTVSTTKAAVTKDKENCLDVDLSPEEQQAIVEACIVSGKPTHKYRKSEHQYKSMVHSESKMQPPLILTDSTINYCTEGTPISISHAASNSDLSLLCPSEDSFLQNSLLPLSSCADVQDVFALPTEEQEKLLNLCIAKGKQTLSNYNNSFDIDKNSRSSSLTEIKEDILFDDHSLLKDMVTSANLVSLTTTCSITDNDCVFLGDTTENQMSEEEEKNLLNQCIVLGMRSMKESSDLENVAPPSFLVEANLDNSLTNVEEITDYPPCNLEFTSKQKRREMKDRYQTYTVKHQLPEPALKGDSVIPKKCSFIRERKSIEKERFKTRTLSRNDFEQMAKCQEGEKRRKSIKLPNSLALNKNEDSSPASESESYQEPARAYIEKPVTKPVKSGIPIVRSKLPKTQSPVNTRPTALSDLPGSLQRQNTFIKEESSGIPVRRNSTRSNSILNAFVENVPQVKSCIPSRIKEQLPKVGVNANLNDKSPDVVKSRWSVSENNLNATSGVKSTSNISLNTSSTYSNTKVSSSISQSGLPVRRESSGRSSGLHALKK